MSGQFFPGVQRMRRRSLMRRALLGAVLLVALIVFAVLWPRPTPGGLSVVTAADTAGATGALRGDLAGVRVGDRVCFSITVRGVTSVLRFPEGWSSDPDLGLRDRSGTVAAVPGSEVTLIGTPGRVGVLPGCTERGRIWTISQLRL